MISLLHPPAAPNKLFDEPPGKLRYHRVRKDDLSINSAAHSNNIHVLNSSMWMLWFTQERWVVMIHCPLLSLLLHNKSLFFSYCNRKRWQTRILLIIFISHDSQCKASLPLFELVKEESRLVLFVTHSDVNDAWDSTRQKLIGYSNINPQLQA